MRYFLILLFSFLTACGSSVPVLKPYKMDIQQGNVVTSKMLLQLKPGMTKSQVRFIMGTPLVVDSFHKNRWDYFYQLRQAGKVVQQRRVILDFEKDLLVRVRGDVVPQGTAGADTGEVAVSSPQVKEKKPEKGLLESLKFWKKDEDLPKTQPVETKPTEVKPADAKPAEAAASAAPESGATEKETPSVLAVPVPIGPTGDAPAAEVVPSQAPQSEPASPAPVIALPDAAPLPNQPEPVKPEAVIVAPAVEPLQEKAAPAAPQPEPPSNAKPDERLIFRLDRTLDSKLLEQEMTPKPAAEPPSKAPASAKKKVDDAPLPPETEPGYFERMLEKIGF